MADGVVLAKPIRERVHSRTGSGRVRMDFLPAIAVARGTVSETLVHRPRAQRSLRLGQVTGRADPAIRPRTGLRLHRTAAMTHIARRRRSAAALTVLRHPPADTGRLRRRPLAVRFDQRRQHLRLVAAHIAPRRPLVAARIGPRRLLVAGRIAPRRPLVAADPAQLLPLAVADLGDSAAAVAGVSDPVAVADSTVEGAAPTMAAGVASS